MRDEIGGNNSLFGNGDSQNSENSELIEDTEDTQEEGSEVKPSESESESQTPSVPDTPVNPPVESESESESESEGESESESESESETKYVTVVVAKGDYARQVAEKVKAAGLIEDAEDFRKYMGNHGYAQKLHAGSYIIPMGATYEEICKILTAR